MKKKKLKKLLKESEARINELIVKMEEISIQLGNEKEQKKIWIERCTQLQKYKKEALAARSERGGYGP